MKIRTVRSALIMCLAAAALQGCAWMPWVHRDSKNGEKCREPALPAQVPSIPPLKAPEGLDPPDTRNAVKIPELTSPDVPRASKSPCLSSPPSYLSV
jgi:uncharacterized lipoprotein